MMQMELSRPDPTTWPPEMMPKRYELAALQPGRIVRLYLRTGTVVWARCTTKQQSDGFYRAEVEDSPALPRGVELRFRKSHVFEIA